MKKLSTKISSCLLSITLSFAFLLPAFIIPSSAWSGKPLWNQATVYLNGKAVVSKNEDFLSVTDKFCPSSVLCGNMVYLPLEIFIECGISVNFDNDYFSVVIDSVNLHDPIIRCERRQNFGNDISASFLANVSNITVAGKQIAQARQNITYGGDSYPSSFYDGGPIYLPVIPILNVFGINTYWDSQSSSLYLNESKTAVTESTVTESIVTELTDTVGLSNFIKSRTYDSNQFTDVSPTAWYADKVKAAYEYGLVSGTGGTLYEPDRNITIAEAIVIASQLHNTYYSNGITFQGNGVWYQIYVDYALACSIITESYPDYNTPISRSEFAIMMSNAFPDTALTPINTIQDNAIPDVAAESNYYNAVYRLYRAGVTSGVDSFGTFNPDSMLTRAEVATILGNMVDTSLRRTFTLEIQPTPTPPTNVPDNSALDKIESAFLSGNYNEMENIVKGLSDITLEHLREQLIKKFSDIGDEIISSFDDTSYYLDNETAEKACLAIDSVVNAANEVHIDQTDSLYAIYELLLDKQTIVRTSIECHDLRRMTELYDFTTELEKFFDGFNKGDILLMMQAQMETEAMIRQINYHGSYMYAKQYVDVANTLNQGMNLFISSINTGNSTSLEKGAEKMKEALSVFIELNKIVINANEERINHILGNSLKSSKARS